MCFILIEFMMCTACAGGYRNAIGVHFCLVINANNSVNINNRYFIEMSTVVDKSQQKINGTTQKLFIYSLQVSEQKSFARTIKMHSQCRIKNCRSTERKKRGGFKANKHRHRLVRRGRERERKGENVVHAKIRSNEFCSS